MIEKVGELLLQTLVKVAIILATLVMALIFATLYSEVDAAGVKTSIITEVHSSLDLPIGWHPPMLL